MEPLLSQDELHWPSESYPHFKPATRNAGGEPAPGRDRSISLGPEVFRVADSEKGPSQQRRAATGSPSQPTGSHTLTGAGTEISGVVCGQAAGPLCARSDGARVKGPSRAPLTRARAVRASAQTARENGETWGANGQTAARVEWPARARLVKSSGPAPPARRAKGGRGGAGGRGLGERGSIKRARSRPVFQS